MNSPDLVVSSRPQTDDLQRATVAVDGQIGSYNVSYSAPLDAGHRAAESFRLAHSTKLKAFEQLWRSMDTLSPLIMALCLWDLGWLRNAKQRLTVESIVGRCGAPSRYISLLAQWLVVLEREGFVSRGKGGHAYAARMLDEPRLRQHVSHSVASLDVSTDYPGFTEYFKTCVRHQAALVAGDASPHRLLFPMGSDRLVNGIYRDNPNVAMHNRTVADIVRCACHANATGRALRILEVGAGTGATTSAILAALSNSRAHYVFTDISRFFIKRATRNLDTRETHVEFELLDIDRDPADQGFDMESVDVIVAANVLHTAKNLHRTLGLLHRLLANDGILVAIETTANTALQMVTFGHFDGVNHFEDHRRHVNLPFLSAAQWRATLSQAGFAGVSTIPDECVAQRAWAQHVIVATTSRT